MLTVLIPCKNESRNITACVHSARLLGGEILVADSGSTDGTLEIVAGMPDCRLIERAFVNYADFKNWAIPQAGEPWVFVLDADERITESLAEEVLRRPDGRPTRSGRVLGDAADLFPGARSAVWTVVARWGVSAVSA